MSLSLSGQRVANGLGLAPSQEKRCKVVVGNFPVFVVGNLDSGLRGTKWYLRTCSSR